MKRALVILVLLEAVLAFPAYFAMLNAIGPSTDYYEPTIRGAEKLPNGKYVADIGDRIYVEYIVVRHKINGNCLLNIERIGEEIGGPRPGTIHLLDYADLHFIGQDELRRARWPLAGLVLGYDVDRHGTVQHDKPLLSPGEDSQEFALYVKARYFCNFMDYVFPRYLQGGEKPDQTERVNLILNRRKSND